MKLRGITPFQVKECKKCDHRYDCLFANATYHHFRKISKSLKKNVNNIPIRKRIPIILGSSAAGIMTKAGMSFEATVDELDENCKILERMGLYFKQGLLWPEQKTGGLGRIKI